MLITFIVGEGGRVLSIARYLMLLVISASLVACAGHRRRPPVELEEDFSTNIYENGLKLFSYRALTILRTRRGPAIQINRVDRIRVIIETIKGMV